MADSTSDSGSVHSLLTEQSSEKKSDNNNNRYYALYSFYPNNRLSGEDRFIPSDVGDQLDGSLSLNIVATNLTATTETDLRRSLAHKLSKSVLKAGDPIFFSVGLHSTPNSSTSAACSYCLIEAGSDSFDFDLVASDGKSGDCKENEQQQFVVCFVSLQDSSLDLFRSEFESYINGLIPLLDKEPLMQLSSPPSKPDASNITSLPAPSILSDQKELSQLSTKIHSYLEQWPVLVVGYLARTLQYFGPGIQQLIHSALLNASLQISGATEVQEDDIKRFISCCSFSTLYERLQSNSESVIGIIESSCPLITQVYLFCNFLTFIVLQQFIYFLDSCNLCKTAAEKLLNFDPSNATKIRDFLDSIKLDFVHKLNELKRFLKQAELDHYALYRAFSYLKNCGCGDLLLRYVKLDGGLDALNLLSVLETFIKDKGLTLL
ncbi:unnamed protein product [Lymnaea stagnalis]|uniref:Protein Njmu-R1 n=1 Tax=Lymnaea stagnalis TaxID=6523 RepID=A0AAV2HZE8_LYMST